MFKWNRILTIKRHTMRLSVLLSMALAPLTVQAAESLEQGCISRSGGIAECANLSYKGASHQNQQGKIEKRMYCVCLSDFSALRTASRNEAEQLQQTMEVKMWATRFNLTVSQFKQLLEP